MTSLVVPPLTGQCLLELEQAVFPEVNELEIQNVGTDPTDLVSATFRGQPVLLSRCLYRSENLDTFVSQIQALSGVRQEGVLRVIGAAFFESKDQPLRFSNNIEVSFFDDIRLSTSLEKNTFEDAYVILVQDQPNTLSSSDPFIIHHHSHSSSSNSSSSSSSSPSSLSVPVSSSSSLSNSGPSSTLTPPPSAFLREMIASYKDRDNKKAGAEGSQPVPSDQPEEKSKFFDSLHNVLRFHNLSFLARFKVLLQLSTILTDLQANFYNQVSLQRLNLRNIFVDDKMNVKIGGMVPEIEVVPVRGEWIFWRSPEWLVSLPPVIAGEGEVFHDTDTPKIVEEHWKDISYAFGVCAYEILTGEQLGRKSPDVASFIQQVTSSRFKIDVSKLPNEASIFSALIKICTSHSPRKRPSFQIIREEIISACFRSCMESETNFNVSNSHFVSHIEIERYELMKILYNAMKIEIPSQEIFLSQHHDRVNNLKLLCLNEIFADLSGIDRSKSRDPFCVKLKDFLFFLSVFGSPKDLSFIERIYQITKSEWFHGMIDRKRAELLLNDSAPKSYLVRFGSKTASFALSVRLEAIEHFLIEVGETSVKVGREERQGVPEAVYYIINKLKLVKAVPNSRYQDIFSAPTLPHTFHRNYETLQ